jgi:hypothetical protein
MAIPYHAGKILRLAGIVCLVLGLFPYLTHTRTTTGAPSDDVPSMPPKSSGVTTTEDTSITSVSLGLTFSPLLEFRLEQSDKKVTTESLQPGGGWTTNFQTSHNTTTGWSIGFLSWSAALVALGVIFLVISIWLRRSGSLAPSNGPPL